ncbi:MAG: Na+/H+ antiporter NhaA [Rickettsiaceae bacterium]|nr:Na+/H+ antiporter NhaA [Rickettsiaceae bacterium]
MQKFTRIHIRKDIISALLLLFSVIAALIISNNDFTLNYYRYFINYKFTLGYGELTLDKSVLKFVNDGLMAIFFFLIGLEMKHHLVEGEFKAKNSLILPINTAIGGFVIPALCYIVFNYESPVERAGWAIPVATDTAFVLGILSLVGGKISNSTKIFVLGLSIVDDVLAITVLAVFYTPHLDLFYLLLCIIPLCCLLFLNRTKSPRQFLYYLGGLILWFMIIKSGIHGTIAGVILALFIPATVESNGNIISFIKENENSVHSVVAFFVLPVFAFVNCELPFNELSIEDFFSSVTIGCFIGLFIGKPLGIFGAMMLSVTFYNVTLPKNCTKLQFLGVAWLCGIGFTLSLFIGLLAFDGILLENQMKLGVLFASLLSAIIGAAIIKISGQDINSEN